MLELTNHQMMQNLLAVYEPKEWGVASPDEVELIKRELHLEEMNIIELRNMRDYTVMEWAIQSQCNVHGKMTQDKMSAITFVIDTVIWDKGGEV